MKRAVLCLAVLLAGCAAAPSPKGDLSPIQAVRLAIEAAPEPVHATVVFEVRQVGADRGITFLNSEPDYRDPKNLAVAIDPVALPALEARFGGPLAAKAPGRRVRVEGAVERVRIGFFDSAGRPEHRYYWQTHLRVVNAAQVQLQ